MAAGPGAAESARIRAGRRAGAAAPPPAFAAFPARPPSRPSHPETRGQIHVSQPSPRGGRTGVGARTRERSRGASESRDARRARPDSGWIPAGRRTAANPDPDRPRPGTLASPRGASLPSGAAQMAPRELRGKVVPTGVPGPASAPGSPALPDASQCSPAEAQPESPVPPARTPPAARPRPGPAAPSPAGWPPSSLPRSCDAGTAAA